MLSIEALRSRARRPCTSSRSSCPFSTTPGRRCRGPSSTGCARSFPAGSAASRPSPRAPAEGHWRDEGETKRDEIVGFEVMTESLDEAFWAAYRRELERAFRQEEIVVRAQDIRLL